MKRHALLSTICICAVLSGFSFGQTLDLSSLDALAAKAKEKTVVNIPPENLAMVTRYLSGADQQVFKDLRGVYLRSYEFEGEGKYNLADLNPVRQQLQSSGWRKIIDIESTADRELVEMYLFSKNEKVEGFALIAAEPEELTLVNILGPVDLNNLAKLRGLGVPDIKKPTAKAKGK